ncbi:MULTISPECIES: bifunctional UDP-N-acetylglucosamine diphosphorylase/glucosamine-1-phosphate N-acetyltransferase GlmU [unclassified Streptomyces]|uniref:bifunctional UDP-N-acetylglucosamine diphosphorylase/glucosamine-1-phosphate N-acetyltransferase GlmU n=1 Tax=unclassified Streptomyces TaxID=2593676 RepID=UPI002DD8ED4E|nr:MULTISPECIES: bifunctional UDP-N-acetylglucosamine diphosphorylase/glucosamine-1-phosphate N-acetyltransferase GlmU [unclassified Streptomyces]WSA94257.1 bifunctional UDP-N-acetylglucosamine diphosphorylase/glucosamine-1-phosphate N-acetyltransferase GlmU [Streptomyces sp. NBC_01795]WSS13121.1 bifunctional UDP-N-acetylglucosamine diphosphorylase/glucosamine-1-phosphate N-acetyltransferase GlmU [Streptomyces sp. NBC_01186]WSS41904.1 bifunctional UDP-N-acetylglucosamine diphosphorylase/glucosam
MSANRPAAVVVLAAGEGTRMKSATPKVLHEICGRSLVGHVVSAARVLDPEHLVVVVGHAREKVTAHLTETGANATTAVQHEQNGTGHAVRMGLEELAGAGVTVKGTVLVTCGDTPLLTGATLQRLADTHSADGNAVTVLTAEVPDATGYGRIVRDPDGGAVTAIVEHKDATEAQRAIREINSGVFAFDGRLLSEALGKVRTDNSQGEEYLTDVLGILREGGHRVGAAVAGDHREIAGINNRVQLSQARRMLNGRLVEDAMLAGVTVIDPATTWMDVTVTYEPDATVHPGTQLLGATHLGGECEVGPNSRLTDTRVGAGAAVSNTVAQGAEIGEGASVGPYTYLRPGTRLGGKVKAGSFVEMKNAQVGEGTKVPHLSYVGDAEIGEHSNIGAASVFVNYDGESKHRTTVGSHCRTGADNMFVAPVTVGDGAYTAAGSVITKDVPAGSLAVARGQQRNIAGWVARKRPGSAAALAAEDAGEGPEGTGEGSAAEG